MRRVRSLSVGAFGDYIAYEKSFGESSIRATGCRLNCRRLSGVFDIDFAANYYLYTNLSVV